MAADEAEVAELSAAGEAPVGGTCATHPERRTRKTCERCGDWACEECLQIAVDERWRCLRCRDLIPHARTLPWEQPQIGPWKRFAGTLSTLAGHPYATFVHLSDGGVGRVAWFIVIMGWLQSVFAITGQVARGVLLQDGVGIAPTVFVLLLSGPLAAAAWLLVVGGLHHLAARLMGSEAPASFSFRAAGYASVVMPLNVVSIPPVVGDFLTLGALVAMGAGVGTMLTGAARGRHGLRGGRALVAGVAPLSLPLLVCGAGLALSIYFAVLAR